MASWFNYVPSERSSSGKGSRSFSLNPIETIGKKRTRKAPRQDTLCDLQFTQLGSQVAVEEDGRVRDFSRAWRPDEEEMCLTTTTVHAQDRNESRVGTERSSPENGDGCITLTREFDWDENKTRLGST